MPKPETIRKQLGSRALDLLESLQVVSDCLQLMAQGRAHQLIPMSGQLRSLLTERSKRAKPLLLWLASELGHSLPVFAMPGVDEKVPPSQSALLFHLAGFPVTIDRQFPEQQEVELSHFVNAKLIRYKGTDYTSREIIEFFANKAGGAHFASEVPKDFAELLSLAVLGQSPLREALRQIGVAALAAGRELFRELVEFEFNATFWVSPQVRAAPTVLYDYFHTHSKMRATAVLLPAGELSVTIRGMDGRQVQASLSADWSHPRHLGVIHTLDDHLRSQLHLELDGQPTAATDANYPVLFVNDPSEYRIYLNRSHDSSEHGAAFALAEASCHSRRLNSGDHAALVGGFMSRLASPDCSAVLFHKGAYGISRVGRTDFTFTGNPTKQTLSGIIAAPA